MDAEQIAISQFLKSWPDQFVSRKEICHRAGGKWRFRKDENWAVPVQQRMFRPAGTKKTERVELDDAWKTYASYRRMCCGWSGTPPRAGEKRR